LNQNFALYDFPASNAYLGLMMVDSEGGHGLRFLADSDPRLPVASEGVNRQNYPVEEPAKYAPDGSSSMVLASGVEARLIEAEVQLHAGNATWLTTLNTLRTDGSYTTAPDTSNPSLTDTTWNAGAGGVAGLRPLADPGTTDTRITLVFRERAFWLYLTGHRQGDLRRLIRQYGRTPDAAFPVGQYIGERGQYGTDVAFPVPAAEVQSNPRFKGCLSRAE
jgi:hypothetical protein